MESAKRPKKVSLPSVELCKSPCWPRQSLQTCVGSGVGHVTSHFQVLTAEETVVKATEYLLEATIVRQLTVHFSSQDHPSH